MSLADPTRWTQADSTRRDIVLEVLAGLWRNTQSLEVAALIEQVSARLVRERREALERTLGRERAHAALVTAARGEDRVAVHALLPWLDGLDRLKGRHKLALLDPPDPVLLRHLVDWYVRRPELNEVREYLARFYNLAIVRALTWRGRFGARVAPPWQRRTLGDPRPELPRSLSADSRRVFTDLRTGFRATRSRAELERDALVEAVYAEPDDDGPRAVLADFLLSEGLDVARGELIGLQLEAARRRLPEPARQRERALLDLHGLRWMGGFAAVPQLASVEFARGFVVGLDLPLAWVQASGVRAPVPADAPIWATVERLNNPPPGWFAQPHADRIRTLGCDAAHAQALLAGPPRPKLQRLTVTLQERALGSIDEGDPDQIELLASAQELLAKLDAVPNLHDLGLRDSVRAEPERWRWLWQGPRARLADVHLRIEGHERPQLELWVEQLRDDRSQVALTLDHHQLSYRIPALAGRPRLEVSHRVPRWRELQAEHMFGFLMVALVRAIRFGGFTQIAVDPRLAAVEAVVAGLGRREVDLRAVEVVAWDPPPRPERHVAEPRRTC